MGRRDRGRRLIVNADDFGLSDSINEAVRRACIEGVLTSASLMVNAPAAGEAVEIARANPGLGVGLHLVLACGTSALEPAQIPRLVDRCGRFSDDPVRAGARYFFQPVARTELRAEVVAQLDAFRATGLELDHVNGHLNLHHHPTVMSILLEAGPPRGMRTMRLTRDWLSLDRCLSRGRWAYALGHALVFGLLAGWAARRLKAHGVVHADRVFGLLRNGRVDEDYVARLIPRLPPGSSELYAHPSLDEFRHEFDAFTSPRVMRLLQEHGIERIRYRDLIHD